MSVPNQTQKDGSFRSWVEWRAGRMDDPVTRLRYLRTVRPAKLRTSKARRASISRLRAGAAVGVMVFAVASGLILRARVRVEPLPSRPPTGRSAALWSEGLPQVWMVEKTGDSESYSNGLRIDSRHMIGTHSRGYRVF